MISKEEVLKIAKLARLELSDKEVEKMQKDLSSILDYFDLLKIAPLGRSPTGEAKPKAAKKEALKNSNVVKDEVAVGKRETTQRIIAAFPDKKDDYIKVKTVL